VTRLRIRIYQIEEGQIDGEKLQEEEKMQNNIS
jgi:hypothetical protein